MQQPQYYVIFDSNVLMSQKRYECSVIPISNPKKLPYYIGYNFCAMYITVYMHKRLLQTLGPY